MTKYMVSWDDDTVSIEAPRSPEIMELVKRVLEVGMNPTKARKAKAKKRVHDNRLHELIHNVLGSPRWKKAELDSSDEDDIVADFHELYPTVEINDHRLRRIVRKVIKGGGVPRLKT